MTTHAASPLSSQLIPAQTAMAAFATRAGERHGVNVTTYPDLHQWSIQEPEAFWSEVWDYFGIIASTGFGSVLDSRDMPGAHWFSGARLNYVDQVLRHDDGRSNPAIVVRGEGRERREVSWAQLRSQVTAFAATLRSAGIGHGDRVVGYLPNADEAIIAFLGTAAVGAIWAGCAPDYGAAAAANRLAQLAPRVLVGVTAVTFAGVVKDRREVLHELVERLTPELVITVTRGGICVGDALSSETNTWMSWADAVASDKDIQPLVTEQVEAEHPLWVLFSSGTTGVPKGIVHGHAGVAVTHLATLGLHQGMGEDDVFFWYTTTNWMLWNIVVGALLLGATTVTYEGSPAYPDIDVLWQVVDQEQVTQFGTSPGHLQATATSGLVPREKHNLATLTRILATGSPVPRTLYDWVNHAVSPDIPLISTSGGTDVVSSFIGGGPGLPTVPGRISGPLLGVSVQAWDDAGHPVRDQVGELVVTLPMPSMPVMFWNDPSGERYRQAYFDTFPGVWRHGDWITHASDGTFIVHGRSDSTLNRNGVRIGSADLYHVAESMPEVVEALVLGVEMPDGSYRMPIFLVVADPDVDRQALITVLSNRLRVQVSPRHVPDEFHFLAAIPHTKTGKKLEVPLKRILQGAPAAQVLGEGVVDRPELIDYFVQLAASWRSAMMVPER